MCFVSQHKLCLVFSFVYVCVRFIQLTLSGLQTSLLFLFFFPVFFFSSSPHSVQRKNMFCFQGEAYLGRSQLLEHQEKQHVPHGAKEGASERELWKVWVC